MIGSKPTEYGKFGNVVAVVGYVVGARVILVDRLVWLLVVRTTPTMSWSYNFRLSKKWLTMMSKYVTFIENSINCADNLIMVTHLTKKWKTIARFAKQNKAVINAWNIGCRLREIYRGKILSRLLSRRDGFTRQLENILACLPVGKARNLCRSLTSFKPKIKGHLPCFMLAIDSDWDVVELYDNKDLSLAFIKSNAWNGECLTHLPATLSNQDLTLEESSQSLGYSLFFSLKSFESFDIKLTNGFEI